MKNLVNISTIGDSNKLKNKLYIKHFPLYKLMFPFVSLNSTDDCDIQLIVNDKIEINMFSLVKFLFLNKGSYKDDNVTYISPSKEEIKPYTDMLYKYRENLSPMYYNKDDIDIQQILEKKVFAVDINGRLANNFFELASGWRIALDNHAWLQVRDVDNRLPKDSFILDFFPITRVMMRTEEPFKMGRIASSFEYHDIKFDGNLLLSAHLQHTKYFEGYEDLFRVIFSDNTQSLDCMFVHIRRGDYINHHLHDVDLTGDIRKVSDSLPSDTKFLVFSDDIPYIKENIKRYIGEKSYEIIDEKDPYKSMMMIASCSKGGICSNSTFSWFGGFLNPKKDKRIFLPYRWFRDERVYKFKDVAEALKFEGSETY